MNFKRSDFVRVIKRITEASGYLDLEMPQQAIETLRCVHAPGPFEAQVEFLRGKALQQAGVLKMWPFASPLRPKRCPANSKNRPSPIFPNVYANHAIPITSPWSRLAFIVAQNRHRHTIVFCTDNEKPASTSRHNHCNRNMLQYSCFFAVLIISCRQHRQPCRNIFADLHLVKIVRLKNIKADFYLIRLYAQHSD